MVHATTILAVRHGDKAVMAGDGQVTLGAAIVKHRARKIRRLYNDSVLADFAEKLPPFSLADLVALTDKADVNHAARIGLTDQNVLENAVTDDGQDILEPANGDWNLIQQYVSERLKK